MSTLLLFIALIVIGNVLDKKKEKAKPIPMPETPNVPPERVRNQKRPKPGKKIREQLDNAYEQTVANPYQQYLDSNPQASEAYANECDEPYDLSHKKHAHYDRGNGLPAGDKVTLAQAIVFGEILGKPKAYRNRNRFIK